MTNLKKECFGILEKIFPMGKDGLREILPSCFECPERKACLQAALTTKEGLELRSHVLDRVPAGGLLGKLSRWSEKKRLSTLIKEKKEGKKWL